MPEFFAEHTPPNLSDFAVGYFQAAEWLLDTDSPASEGGVDRDKLRGFSRAAIACGAADCATFCESYVAELAAYVTESGRDMESAGVDYFLSRNGHGAGFFDRGNGPVFRDLQQAARLDGTVDTYVARGWIHFSGEPARPCYGPTDRPDRGTDRPQP
jgi:hypothetical protein